LSIVLDASMTAAWLFDDERTTAVEGIVRGVASQGALVPAIWRLEVANLLRNAVRRRRCDEAFADESFRRLGRMVIAVDPQTDERAWSDTLALSRSENLTLYDAAYLELAIRTGETLASLDVDLIAAAARRGVAVLTA